MNSKNTKRALLTSALAMIVCLAMLVGSTFAWFTDTASTGVNKIQAGNLNIELQMKDNDGKWVGAEGKTLSFLVNGKIPTEGTQILWEPGCTYELPALRVVNKGNLALKYKIQITGINGSAKLNKVIDWTINDKVIDLTEGHLTAGQQGDAFTIKGHMQETAGNEYQKEFIDGIAITVYATQDTVENDSFDNKYDKYAAYSPSGAMYTVTNYEEAKNAFASGGGITIAEYIEADATKTEAKDRLVIKYPSVIDLNAAVHVPGSLEATANWATFFINADTTINASQAGGILCTDKLNPAEGAYKGGPYVAHVSGDGIVVTVNGGTYHGGGTVFNVEKGTLIVNGGFFQVTPDVDTNDCRYVLNCIDANYKNGTANIIVNGGTFVNFDPSNNAAEGAGTNFVADGHSVIKETQANGDVWYTVV